MYDEREGKLSSSYLEQADLCPGSWLAQRNALKAGIVARMDTADSAEGTKLHGVMEGRVDTDELNGEQLAAVQKAERLYDETRRLLGLQTQWDRLVPHGEEARELRVWVRNPDDSKLVSGKLDLLEMNDQISIITDWKFGRLDVESAPGNLQVMTTALAHLQDKSHRTKVYGCIIQPFAAKGYQTSVVLYQRANMTAMYHRIKSVEENALSEYAPRRPSPKACRYCLVKALCPEANASATSITNTKVEALAPQQIAELLDRFEMATKIIEAGKARAKAMLAESPDAIPGWKLGEAGKKASIRNANAAFNVLRSTVHPDDILSVAQISLDQLAEAHRKRCEIPKAAARQQIEEELARYDLLEITPTSPRLTRSHE